ncbi:MAG: hypothetical protein AAGI63_18180 [Planctomycetota bacterium]
MANRSYLYTRHTGDDVEFRDIAEWRSAVPPAYLILVGANATPCRSQIWDAEKKIAIEGDAHITRPLFLRLLDWLEPQVQESFADAAKNAREILLRTDREGNLFHLELGEVYELIGLDLDEMEAETIKNAALGQALFLDVKRVLETKNSTIDSFEHFDLRSIKKWEEEFGCYFSDVLYFHLGG